jgi:hypothetical protein
MHFFNVGLIWNLLLNHYYRMADNNVYRPSIWHNSYVEERDSDARQLLVEFLEPTLCRMSSRVDLLVYVILPKY